MINQLVTHDYQLEKVPNKRQTENGVETNCQPFSQRSDADIYRNFQWFNINCCILVVIARAWSNPNVFFSPYVEPWFIYSLSKLQLWTEESEEMAQKEGYIIMDCNMCLVIFLIYLYHFRNKLTLDEVFTTRNIANWKCKYNLLI